LTYAPFN
jgi:cell division cycle 14